MPLVQPSTLDTPTERILTAEERESKRPFNYFSEKAENGFVGLSNQGATCYMNSLLQTLYMTPEFREALYKWEYSEEKEGPASESIPFQLQKLFAELQLTNHTAVPTMGLTKSFGWGTADAFEQHDIQELNRVLFDALERAFKGTPQETLVNDLYQGVLGDQIICQECKNVSSRDDMFLDIPVVMRNVTTLTGALDLFVEPEILDGDNKYQCDKCNKKCTALKGLKIKKLPYLLTIQLKRFDIDFTVMERIKLNTRLEFPRYLDMDEYINPEKQQVKRDAAVERLRKKENETEVTSNDVDVEMDEFEEDEMPELVAEVEEEEEEDSEEVPPPGDHIYELYSILIHSGNADYGHYYAYVKSLETKQWFNFDDDTVSTLEAKGKKEIEESFGGSGMLQRGTNAYMLVYRKVHTQNKGKVPHILIPECLRQAIQRGNVEYTEEYAIYKEKKEKLPLKIYTDNEKKNPHMYTAQRSDSLAGLLMKVFLEIPEVSVLAASVDDLRFRELDFHNNLSDDYYGREEESLEALFLRNNSSLFVESRKPGVDWKRWSKTELSLRVVVYSPEIVDISEAPTTFTIYIEQDATLGDLRTAITNASEGVLQGTKLRIFKMSSRLFEFQGDEKTLRFSLSVYNRDKLFVEECEEGSTSGFMEWYKLTKDLISLRFNALGAKEADQVIKIDRNSTLGELKEKLLPNLEGVVSCDDFIVTKQFAPKFSSWKDNSQKLTQLGLSDNRTLVISKGTPLKPGQFTFAIRVFYLDGTKDSEARKLIVEESWTFQHLKEELSPIVNLSADLMRIRDCFGSGLGKIYCDSKKRLSESFSSLYDGRPVAIEQIAQPEELDEKNRLVLLRQYLPQEVAFGAQFSAFLPFNSSSEDFFTQCAILIMDNIPLEFLRIAKPYGPHVLSDASTCKSLNWKAVGSSSWVLFDSDIFVCKDSREDVEEEEEEETATTSSRVGLPAAPRFVTKAKKEDRGLKINVQKYDNKKEEEEGTIPELTPPEA